MLRLWPIAPPTRTRLRSAALTEPVSVRPEVDALDLGNERATAPDDYAWGEWEGELGSGAEVFRQACDAIRDWKQFPEPLIRAEPTETPIAIGETVALQARVGPVHGAFCCRITEVVDERTEAAERFGFVYTTIEGHVERGKELFLVEHDRSSGRVIYRIRALSRSAHPIGWFGLPIVRLVQQNFGPKSTAALRRAIDAEPDLPPPRALAQRPFASLPWVGAVLWQISLLIGPHSSRLDLCTFAALVLLPAARPLLPEGWWRSRSASAAWLVSAGAFAFVPWGEALWFVATTIAAARAVPLLVQTSTSAASTGACLGLLLLPVGALWALLYREGWWPGDFPPAVVELTALHFHYAGAIFPLLFGHAVGDWRTALVRRGLVAYLVAVSGVALGITFSATLEFVSAITLIAIGGGLCAAQFRAALASPSVLGRRALAVSSAALAFGLALALGYATLEWQGATNGAEEYSGGGVLPWQRMIPLHGWTMALGFCAFGIRGWGASRETTRRADAPE